MRGCPAAAGGVLMLNVDEEPINKMIPHNVRRDNDESSVAEGGSWWLLIQEIQGIDLQCSFLRYQNSSQRRIENWSKRKSLLHHSSQSGLYKALLK